MRDCECGRPVRLSAMKVIVGGRKGVAHAIVHTSDGTDACGGDWSCSALKPYPRSPFDQEWQKLLDRWAAKHCADSAPDSPKINTPK